MQFRNFPIVPRVVYGRGSFQQVSEILELKRVNKTAPFIFLVDHFFQNKTDLTNQIPLAGNDKIIFVDVTHEPKTSYVDSLRNQLQEEYPEISGVIGIGGGSAMDLAKAVAIMLNNVGSSAEYQGWDLIKNPAVYHVGIPTLSGTGAEVSRTTVLSGPTRKLGLNSDYTPFDQLVLDPQLIKNVPKNQRFYTGMDCYIHCVESLTGSYLNAFSQSYGEKAMELCQDIFLNKDEWDDESDEKLMMASYHGGMSIAYSQVGVAHAISYGLSFLLGTRHGIGNCMVFNHLDEYYPEYVEEFKEMVQKHQIDIPTGICASLSDADFDTMIGVALSLEPLWENAIGPNWKREITPSKLRELYEKI